MTKGIRLPATEVEIIKRLFQLYFEDSDHLWIFGSRTYLDKRGGDIDLYIQTQELDIAKANQKKNALILALWNEIGEQKIDVVLHLLHHPCDLPIYKVAQEEGIQLL
jgi:hypothetical protein